MVRKERVAVRAIWEVRKIYYPHHQAGESERPTWSKIAGKGLDGAMCRSSKTEEEKGTSAISGPEIPITEKKH